jgi:flagellar protein FliS
MHHQTPYGAGAYSAIGIETGVEATDPLGLVVMLYDGAIQAILRAEYHLSRGEIEGRGLFTSRAIDIVNQGLSASLDRQVGGELANGLASLYDYMSRRLYDANLKGDATIYVEVRTLLGELRESWETLRKSQSAINAGAASKRAIDPIDRRLNVGRSVGA